MNTDLIEGYIDQLEEAARALPTTRRRELVEEVREHITEDLARAGRDDEVGIRNVLERLGPPDAIVAAELTEDPPAASATGATRSGFGQGVGQILGPTEVLAVVLLTVGAFAAPLIGPMVGLVLTWVSSRWSMRTKVAITFVAVLVLVLPIVLLGAVTTTAAPPSR